MRNKRKMYISLFIALLLIISPFGTLTTNAGSNIISETSVRQDITEGVTLENIVRFTTNGWLNINILRADLTDPNIKVDALTSQDSINKLSSVKTMVSGNGAVAGVNASFFTPDGSGTGHPVGTLIQSGNLLCASSDINKYGDSMASISLTKQNEPLWNFWKTTISLTAVNGTVIPVSQYNKPNGSQYTDFSIFDRKWSAASIGASQSMPDIVQMVVDGGKVTQILASQPAVQIPENGYVVITRTDGGKKLMQNFAVGDAVTMNITSTPDWSNINMSVSGSAVLVKDGQIPTAFSFSAPDVAKASPKTAIGSTRDGRQLILVTVDGRQNSSIGMTLTEMAQYMLSLGAYNAINMDGGGSTTMVARPLGTDSAQTLNSPSDGIARSISTAIGIFSLAPPSDLKGLIIDTEDANIFVNTTRAFKVRGYDKFLNPYAINPDDVKWSVSGVKGIFNGDVFCPSSAGEGKITVKVGNISASLPISVLSSPARLMLDSSSIKLPAGKSKAFTVTGANKNGYEAAIDPSDILWTVSDGIGTVSNGSFNAINRGAGYIDASVGNTHAYCTVSVSDDITIVKDDFEKPNGSFLSYPNTVTGAYELSQDTFHSGTTSGKLTYDFTNTEGTRAAYMVLPNGGMPLEAGVSKIGLWVNNDHTNSNWIRAEIVDSKGQKQMVDLKRTLDWTGWGYIEAPVDSISFPGKLTRLYAVQVNPIEESGVLYFDDLTVTVSGYPAIDPNKIPKDTVPVDDANKATSFTKATATSFRFGVFGQSRVPKNPLEKLLMGKYAKKADSAIDMVAIVGDGAHDSLSGLIKKKKVVATNTVDLKSTKNPDYKYAFSDFKNSRFFKLDMRNGGLRLSDPAEWQQFLVDLNSFKGSNVFIMMENSPDTFKDNLEEDFFKDTLTNYKQKSGKNVWVFYKGNTNGSSMYRGIRYISTAGYEIDGLTPDKTDSAQYALVTVKGTTVTYTFRPLT